ncbi:MAG: ABC transporter ATP-binding protein [Pseudomonadota bacterium]
MSHQTLISLRDVSFAYGNRLFSRGSPDVLARVSFDVLAGETLAVLGRNGAGKTTLLRLLAGIFAPDSGKIWRADVEISLLSLQVGFVEHLSGRQNARISAMMLGKSRSWVDQHIDEIADFAELGSVLDRPLKTYSAGMRARLGFSVGYLADPEVILIDEVLGVGDIEFQEKSSAAMKERLQSNKTVVLVTHQLDTVAELADRVVWIEGGEVRNQGAVGDIIAAYRAYSRDPG